MTRQRSLLLCALLGTAMLGCTPSLTALRTPVSVIRGSTFEVEVEATFTGFPSGATSGVAAVLQLPSWVNVEDAWVRDREDPVINDPMVLSLFTAEPGQQLYSFSDSGTESISSALLRLRLRATQRGVINLKLAFASLSNGQPWQVAAPGPSDFSMITSASFVRSIVVEDTPQSSADIWQGYGDSLPLSLTDEGWKSAILDINGDGLDDLALVRQGDPGPRFFFAGGQGFWVESSLGLLSGSGALAFGDANGDGFADLFCGSGELYLGDGAGGWNALPTTPISPAADYVAVGDFDGNGLDDFIAASRDSGVQLQRLTQGGLSFAPIQSLNNASPFDHTTQLLADDLDGDGCDDLLTMFDSADAPHGTAPAAPKLSQYRMGTPSGLGAQVDFRALPGLAEYASSIAARDIDGDGDTDFATFGIRPALFPFGFPSLELVFIENLSTAGNPVFAERFVRTESGSIPAMTFADVDGDGTPELVYERAPYSGTGSLNILRSLGSFPYIQGPIPSGFPESLLMYPLINRKDFVKGLDFLS